uniref:Uncharacterized protein n=1 Tax=Oryza glumipatula TaxID=40148 RepID=A0A0E0B470_9ORYZ
MPRGRPNVEEPMLEEVQPWEAAVDELRLYMVDLQRKVEEDHKLVQEQLQNQAVQAQVHKDEVMQNLLSIKEMLGETNSCLGQEVKGPPQTPVYTTILLPSLPSLHYTLEPSTLPTPTTTPHTT